MRGRWIAEKRRVVSEERRRQRAQRQRSHVAVDVAPAPSADVNELLECVSWHMTPACIVCLLFMPQPRVVFVPGSLSEHHCCYGCYHVLATRFEGKFCK